MATREYERWAEASQNQERRLRGAGNASVREQLELRQPPVYTSVAQMRRGTRSADCAPWGAWPCASCPPGLQRKGSLKPLHVCSHDAEMTAAAQTQAPFARFNMQCLRSSRPLAAETLQPFGS